jgi:hypothetical protein
MKNIFVYENKIFSTEILIVVNSDYNKLKKWILKNAEDNLKDYFKKDIGIEKFTNFKNCDGAMHYIEYKNETYFILVIKYFNDKWIKYELLLHEIVHLKQHMFKERNIEDENEFEAYFIQNTFSDIRTLLQNCVLDKKVKKKKNARQRTIYKNNDRI